ncbi:hypothetical protein AC579_4782 [Pseudocercospora musae]|uniref:Uncharacterized protein n=1 Tax=Pseudocercospora musae TaxID=113226 RepID=A0A139I7U8_9PEZI|nr:hypothetical protein AC579_4782 [Pseudocercospora musae]
MRSLSAARRFPLGLLTASWNPLSTYTKSSYRVLFLLPWYQNGQNYDYHDEHKDYHTWYIHTFCTLNGRNYHNESVVLGYR